MEFIDDEGVPMAEALRLRRRRGVSRLEMGMASREVGMVVRDLVWFMPRRDRRRGQEAERESDSTCARNSCRQVSFDSGGSMAAYVPSDAA